MIKSQLKIILRTIKKQPGYSFINIAGLTCGITCSLMIWLFVQDELSYDRYHEKANQIYRVAWNRLAGTNELKLPFIPAPLAEIMVSEYPEVIQAVRFFNLGNYLIRYKDNRFIEDRFYLADSTVFETFTIPFIQGDPKTALVQPNSIVITQEMAEKYFGNEDPLGKSITLQDRFDLQVTGIIENLPQNTHFHFDFLAPMALNPATRSTNWNRSPLVYTYIVLQQNVSKEHFEAILPELIRKYWGPTLQANRGISFNEWLASGNIFEFFLQPLTSIHLHSNLHVELEANSDIKYVYIFSSIAFFVLLIACVNYINLTTARSAKRAKEIGVKKIFGVSRKQLIQQFTAESILLSFIAVFLSVMLIQLLLPALNNLAGKELEAGYLNNWRNIGGLFGLMLFVGILAGSYPAFFLSSCKPVNVFKGIFSIKKNSRSPLRRSMVVFQITVSIILIISTIIVHNQLNYTQDKKLGFQKEYVLVIEKESALGGKHEAFKQELSKHPGVIRAGRSTAVPGISWGSATFLPEDAASNETHRLWLRYADHDFAESLNLEMADGRYFSNEFPTDSSAVIINEAAVRSLGWQEPIGKSLASGDGRRSYKVIGVVKDFHFQSLHQQISPIAMLLPTASYYCLWNVRIRPENVKETLTFVQNTWESFSNGQPMKFYFLDDDLNMKYKSEQKMGRIFSAFSVVAIFIACLGLFGLSSFTAEQRTKEIGIRKVLGASVSNIVQLFSKELTRWVILANIIAWPIAYFVMSKWLQNFAYRIDFDWWVFVLTGVTAVIIALITVSFQAAKAAQANPVDVLRYE